MVGGQTLSPQQHNPSRSYFIFLLKEEASVSLSLSPFLCLSLCLPVSVSLSPCLCLSLCLPVSVSLSPCLCLSLCLPVSVSLSPCLCLSLCLPVSVCLCLCLSFCLSVYHVYLSARRLVFSCPFLSSLSPGDSLPAAFSLALCILCIICSICTVYSYTYVVSTFLSRSSGLWVLRSPSVSVCLSLSTSIAVSHSLSLLLHSMSLLLSHSPAVSFSLSRVSFAAVSVSLSLALQVSLLVSLVSLLLQGLGGCWGDGRLPREFFQFFYLVRGPPAAAGGPNGPPARAGGPLGPALGELTRIASLLLLHLPQK